MTRVKWIGRGQQRGKGLHSIQWGRGQEWSGVGRVTVEWDGGGGGMTVDWGRGHDSGLG